MEDITITPQTYDLNVEPESYISMAYPTSDHLLVVDNIEIIPEYDTVETVTPMVSEKKVRENGDILLEILETLKEIKSVLQTQNPGHDVFSDDSVTFTSETVSQSS